MLTCTAQADCWVEVHADGVQVMNRVLAEGETQTFEANGEIVLSVGNAGGLAFTRQRPAGRAARPRAARSAATS